MFLIRDNVFLMTESKSGSGSEESESGEESGEESGGSSSDEGDTLETLQKRFGVAPTKKKVSELQVFIRRERVFW